MTFVYTVEQTDITWSPIADLYTDAAATTAYTDGVYATTVYFKPSVGGVATYTASSNSDEGCASSSAVNITVAGGGVPDVCEIIVTIFSDNTYGDEVEWMLKDADDNIVLSGGPYLNFGYTDTQSTMATNPPYYLIIDREGNFCDNEASYTVTVGGDLDVSGTLQGGCGVESFNIMGCPSCSQPSGIVVSDITFSSAVLNWQGSNISYDVEWGTQGFIPGSGTMVSNILTNTLALTNLTAETNYEFYIRQTCSGGALSSWAGPIAFFSGYCIPTTTYPGDYLSGFSTTNAIQNVSYATAQYDGAYHNLSSQIIEQSQGLPFNFTTTYVGGSNTVKIWVDQNQDMQFDDSEIMYVGSANAAASNQAGIIVIPETADIGSYRMRVRADYGASSNPAACGETNYGSTLDFTLVVSAAPACVPPSFLEANDISFNSAELSWTSLGTLFDIEWGVAGFTPTGTPTSVATTGIANPFQLSGLVAETSYDYYVRQDCGSGTSTWSGPFTFFTGYCVPQNTGNYFLNNISSTGGYTNITHTATSRAPGGYANLSASQIVSASPGQSIGVNISANTSTHFFYLWIDLNNNLSFDDVGETIIATTTYTSSYAGTIILPTDIPLGDYRVRVGSSWLGLVTPCGPANGEYKDFTLSVIAPPSCLPPSDLGVSDTTATSTNLLWSGSGTSFDIEWGLAGFTPTGTPTMSNVTSPYPLTNLQADTSYQFYVRQLCNTQESLWAGPYTFFTGYCIPSTTYTPDFISSFATTGATQNVTYTATTQPTGSYANETAQIIEQEQGASFDFTSVYEDGGQKLNIWIDWNNDLVFTADEKVYSAYSDGNNQAGTISIPATALIGQYRMRVRAQFGMTVDPDSCGEVNYGSTIDFTLQVTEDTSGTKDFDASVFKVYPNPVKDFLNISYSKDIQAIAIVNMLGQTLYTTKVNTTDTQVDMTSLPTGNYLVKVTFDGVVRTIKVVKQ